MATITLTKYAGLLATNLATLRRSTRVGAGGQDGKEDTGLQRIGILRDNSGQAFTCYWDPNTTTILYDDGSPVLSQE